MKRVHHASIQELKEIWNGVFVSTHKCRCDHHAINIIILSAVAFATDTSRCKSVGTPLYLIFICLCLCILIFCNLYCIACDAFCLCTRFFLFNMIPIKISSNHTRMNQYDSKDTKISFCEMRFAFTMVIRWTIQLFSFMLAMTMLVIFLVSPRAPTKAVLVTHYQPTNTTSTAKTNKRRRRKR